DLRTSEGGAFDIDYANPQHYLIDLFRCMQACPIPIIARVNGHAMAGGLGLVCACDMAITADDARFGTPEAKVGVFPMMILTHMLRILPRRKLVEMCFTAEAFDANTALDLGLVNFVVPRKELDARLDKLIAQIVANAPTSLRLGKQAIQAMQDMSLPEAFEYAQLMVAVMSSTADAREGIAAFREKRKPAWTGK
ncbi:MAG: enoyl-CoA hydratase-related protein, partial [Desulfobacterales bacterium]|nr:enoyl-CoA hydratase-related protein [Desulfobacterales bacterium]